MAMIYQRIRDAYENCRRFLATGAMMAFLLVQGGCSWRTVTVEGIVIRETDPPQDRLVVVDDKGRRYVLDIQEGAQQELEKQNTLYIPVPGGSPVPLRIMVEGERYEARWYGHEHTYIRVHRWEVRRPVTRSTFSVQNTTFSLSNSLQ